MKILQMMLKNDLTHQKMKLNPIPLIDHYQKERIKSDWIIER